MTRRTPADRIAHVEAARPGPPLTVTVVGAVQASPRGLRALARLLEIGMAVDAAGAKGERSGS